MDFKCPECDSLDVVGLDNEGDGCPGALQCSECGFVGLDDDFPVANSFFTCTVCGSHEYEEMPVYSGGSELMQCASCGAVDYSEG